MTTLQQHVWSDEKERPPTDKKWSHRLRLLLNSAWSSTIEERPSMSDIEDILHEEVLNLRDGDETGMSHSQRRSTFVLNRGDSSTISSRGPRRMSSGWSNSCG